MSFSFLCHAAFVSIPFILAAEPASAHHAMEGQTPSTFGEGLLSGLGHPVIGPDHLAFLFAIGVVVGGGGLCLALPAAFIAAMAIGVIVHVNGVGLPAAEFVVAMSVLLAGFVIVSGRVLPSLAWIALFLVAGLFHGYAFGESISGANASVLNAYLLGLVLIQSALTVSFALIIRRTNSLFSEKATRLAGVAIVGVGVMTMAGLLFQGA